MFRGLRASARPPLQFGKGTTEEEREQIRRANLQCIQQVDAFADEVLACFPNVACYKYNKDERKWDRTGLCGPLLLYHRLDRPYFSLMLAKVDSMEVCTYPLTETVKMRFTAPHLELFRPETPTIALWLGDEVERRRLYSLLKLIRRLLTRPPAQVLLLAVQVAAARLIDSTTTGTATADGIKTREGRTATTVSKTDEAECGKRGTTSAVIIRKKKGRR